MVVVVGKRKTTITEGLVGCWRRKRGKKNNNRRDTEEYIYSRPRRREKKKIGFIGGRLVVVLFWCIRRGGLRTTRGHCHCRSLRPKGVDNLSFGWRRSLWFLLFLGYGEQRRSFWLGCGVAWPAKSDLPRFRTTVGGESLCRHRQSKARTCFALSLPLNTLKKRNRNTQQLVIKSDSAYSHSNTPSGI